MVSFLLTYEFLPHYPEDNFLQRILINITGEKERL